MNELTLDGKTYVSSKRAAEITGYAKDYVGQLCREGRVEARLVGRNWYILESALREHRFGPEKDQDVVHTTERTYASSAWEAPRYAHEAPSILPSLSDRTSVNALSDAHQSQNSTSGESISAQPSTLLTDMQSAWQEWYERKEVAQDTPEIVVPLENPVAVQEEEAPLYINEATDEKPLAEMPAFSTPETTLDLSHSARYVNAYESDDYQEGEESTEEGRIVEEKVLRTVSNTGIAISASLIRSMLVAVVLLVVTVTVLGSGLLEQFGVGNSITRSSEIRYLAGVSFYNH